MLRELLDRRSDTGLFSSFTDDHRCRDDVQSLVVLFLMGWLFLSCEEGRKLRFQLVRYCELI